jgi:hypothetical protein
MLKVKCGLQIMQYISVCSCHISLYVCCETDDIICIFFNLTAEYVFWFLSQYNSTGSVLLVACTFSSKNSCIIYDKENHKSAIVIIQLMKEREARKRMETKSYRYGLNPRIYEVWDQSINQYFTVFICNICESFK